MRFGNAMNDSLFRDVLDLFMVCDPWPLSIGTHLNMVYELDKEAQKRGFSGWVEAYHWFSPNGQESAPKI